MKYFPFLAIISKYDISKNIYSQGVKCIMFIIYYGVNVARLWKKKDKNKDLNTFFWCMYTCFISIYINLKCFTKSIDIKYILEMSYLITYTINHHPIHHQNVLWINKMYHKWIFLQYFAVLVVYLLIAYFLVFLAYYSHQKIYTNC